MLSVFVLVFFHILGASSSVNMNSMSEIASCSYEARSMGVRNGMFVGTARVKCPALTCVPYYFESYRTVSQKFYEILVSYTSEIEAVSCDEALLDISDLIDDSKCHIFTFICLSCVLILYCFLSQHYDNLSLRF